MDPAVDFVLVFSVDPDYNSPVRGLGHGQDQAVRAKRVDQVRDEFSRLVAVLQAADLTVTSRRGAKGTSTVLVFVKASEKRVREEATRESPKPSPREPRDFAAAPIEESERLRLVYSILTSPRTAGSTSVRSSASTGLTCGLPVASLLPPTPANKVEFPHLYDMFPPHNPAYNKLWLRRWAKLPSNSPSVTSSKNPLDLLTIPQSELDDLKAHLGERVAMYFAFLTYYFRSLVFPSALGLFFWLMGLPYHPLLGLGFVGWSLIFVESWRLRENAIAVQWGTYHLDRVEADRPGFQGDGLEVDPVTGVTRQKWRFQRTLTRGLASLPAYFTFVGALGALVSGIYIVETLVGEVYDGPGKRFLTLVPTVLFVTLVPQVSALWGFTATKLTNFENHPRQSEYEASLTVKTFALNFVAAYGNLLLTSYVYIPFGSFLVPHILQRLPSRQAAALSTSTSKTLQSGSFSINASKLHTQLVAYSLTNQITGAFLEVGLPYLKAKVLPKVQEKMHSSTVQGKLREVENDHEDEKDFLKRIREEQQLPTNYIFSEYAEMATQFGYLVLFGVIWPLSPIWSLVNNFFEIRSDAFKIATQARRPIPNREASIGPWLEVFGFVSYVGALTTSSLIYLYQPRETFRGTAAQYVANLTAHNVTLPADGSVPYWTTRLSAAQSASLPPASDAPELLGALPPAHGSFLALDAIKRTLLFAAVVALASSHLYTHARTGVRWLLTRLAWDGSIAHQLSKRRELELKRAWLDEHEMRIPPKEMARRALGWAKQSPEEEGKREGHEGYKVAEVGAPADAAADVEGLPDFWKREDEGKRLMESLGKTD
ncbi:hypothetical protein Rhopal_006490-T1 [Rhodotorula paludigena]|uniref:DUF590-domain-containing protein n=1 Tax=Rhodotorula paludigena TaxID=86838 RepID=A0AAV5GU15_9BASI|nr:hypothetical protein Rhopal_006490-T1 [Rhodotorula paludigena]